LPGNIHKGGRFSTFPERTAKPKSRRHKLLGRFKALTGCPVLVNASFNVRGEPIVCTPEDAFRCFMGNELDLLVVGNCDCRKPSWITVPRGTTAC
jgi:predicted NodU family carbamoyl transferase